MWAAIASMLGSVGSALGSAGSATLGALGSLGKGVLQGAGSALGLAKNIPTVMTKNPVTGAISKIAMPETTSVWGNIGKTLGGGAVSGALKPPSIPSASFPSADTSTRVQQSAGYQGKKKKSQIETLIGQLAGR